jgi:hypothetical protein
MQVVLEIGWEQRGEHMVRTLQAVQCDDPNLRHTVTEALGNMVFGAQPVQMEDQHPIIDWLDSLSDDEWQLMMNGCCVNDQIAAATEDSGLPVDAATEDKGL